MDVDPPAAVRRRRFGAWLVMGIVVLATLALVVSALALRSTTGGERRVSLGAGQGPPAADPSAAQPAPPQVLVVAVGDSITVAGGDIATGHLTDLSWVRYAVGEPLIPHGGWAVSGATTTQMAAGFVPPTGDAYVLVIFAGTNDVAVRLPFAESRRNLVAIADRAQEATGVFVTAIPPLVNREAEVARYNGDLAALAAERGWTFVDPMGAVSAGGRWVEGMTHDGIHPTAQGAQLIGSAIRAAVIASSI